MRRGRGVSRTSCANRLGRRGDLADRFAVAEHLDPAEVDQAGRVGAERPQRRDHHHRHRAGDPSTILTASARPSGRAAANTPSAPSLATSPGTASISRVTVRPVPPSHHGWARTAAATRCSGVPGAATASRAKARARPATLQENSGAPQPSTLTCAGSPSPVSAITSARMARCSGCSGSR